MFDLVTMESKIVSFSVVQTIEKGLAKLSIMPSQWTVSNGWNSGILDGESEYRGKDLMFWPATANGRKLMNAAELDINVLPNDTDCSGFRCIIKRKNLASKSEVSLASLELLRSCYCFSTCRIIKMLFMVYMQKLKRKG